MSETVPSASERRLVEALQHDGCPICEERTAFEAKYREWFFIERYHQQELLADLTDSLSFCPDHAPDLVHPYTLEVVTRRTLSRFADGDLDRLRRESLSKCPACRSRDEAAARNVSFLRRGLQRNGDENDGHSGVLCVPHLQSIAEDAPAEMLESLLEDQDRALRSALDDLHATDEGPTSDEQLPATIRTALEMSVGHEPVSFALPPPGDDRSLERNPVVEFVEAIERGDGCPVCLEIARAWDEWITWLDRNTGTGDDISELLPTCREHVWGCVQYGSVDLARAVAIAALSPRLERVTRAKGRFAATDANGPDDTSSFRWILPQSIQHVSPAQSMEEKDAEPVGSARTIEHLRSALVHALGDRLPQVRRYVERRQTAPIRQSLNQPIRCPVCDRLDTARERSLDLLLALLEQRQYRTAFEDGYGLCLKHFAWALSRDPAPEIRDFLVDVESAKVKRLHWELREAQRKRSWDARPEQKGAGFSSDQRAAARFSGSYRPITALLEESP